MTTFTTDDVTRMADNLKEIKELKAFVAQRTEFYLLMNKNQTVNLENHDGFVTDIYDHELFNPAVKEIRVTSRDSQYGWTTEYKVPRDFVFGPKTQEEKEYEEYLNLKKKFDK